MELMARYPNTRLSNPKLTEKLWVQDTAHLPLDELRDCVQFVVENDSSGFIPTAGKILAAYVDRRCVGWEGVYNVHLLPEEMNLTRRVGAASELRALKRGHADEQLRLQCGDDIADFVDAIAEPHAMDGESR